MKIYFLVISLVATSSVFATEEVPPAPLPGSAIARAVGQTLMTKWRTMGYTATSTAFKAALPAIEGQVARVALLGAAGSATGVGAVPTWLWLLSGVVIDYTVKVALDAYLPNYGPPADYYLNNPDARVRSGVDPVTQAILPPVFTWTETKQIANPVTGTALPVFPLYKTFDLYACQWVCSGVVGDEYNWWNSAKRTALNQEGAIAVNLVQTESYYMNNPYDIRRYIHLAYHLNTCGVSEVWPACTGAQDNLSTHYTRNPTDTYEMRGASCPIGYSWMGNSASNAVNDPGRCQANPFVTSTDSYSKTAPEFEAGLDPRILDAPVNPYLLAQLADAYWALAAREAGYTGIPYQFYNPVTVNDVTRAFDPAINTGEVPIPKVRDFFGPVPLVPGSTAGTGTVSLNPIISQTVTIPANPPAVIDLGLDPAIPAPILEAIPTAAMILAPILGLFSDLRNYSVPNHDSVCPTPSTSLFGKVVKLESHCSLFEPIREKLYLAMAAAWAIIAVFIILSA